MKKLLLPILLVMACRVGFADTKISAMTSTTTLNAGDVIPVVANPSGTPTNNIITKTNFATTLDILTNAAAAVTFASVGTSTASLQTQVNNLNTSTATIATSTASLQTQVNSLNTSTATIATSTASLQTQVNSLNTSTATIATSTASLQTQVNNLNTSTATIATSTASLQTQVNSLNTSTATIATSTASLQTQVNTLSTSTSTLKTQIETKVNYSSFSATSPITYNNATGGIGFLQTVSSFTTTSTFTVTFATINLNGVNMNWPSSGTVGNYLQYASTNTVQWGTVPAAPRGLGVSWDGGGSALTTGTTYWLVIPATGTITELVISGLASGSVTVNVSSSSVFNTLPVPICASACPTLTSGTIGFDTTLAGWAKALVKDGFLYFVVNSVTTISQLNVTLEYSIP